MPRPDVVVLIPESTRKHPGGDPKAAVTDGFASSLPTAARSRLEALREEVRGKSAKDIARGGLLPAYRRFDGNMYRSIEPEAWARRAPNVEVLIASGLFGLIASLDTVPAYKHSMAESMPPFGKLNRWWHERGLPGVLTSYLQATRPVTVVDLLSLEYREAVEGYAGGLAGIDVQMINFPGMGRASQPRRGERVTEILRTGKA
jgi:cytoplasmic iron level regulating protein YaaA (DUF328/UPF0246 family)